MTTIELSVQKQEDFCVCAVLQAIFKRHGLNISQEEIAGNLTIGTEQGYRVHDERIKTFMLKYGFDYASFWADETPFNEPDELLKEMQKYDGFIGIGKHAYVLKEFQDPKIMLLDPKNGQEVEKDYFELLREMGHDGVFGLIRHIS